MDLKGRVVLVTGGALRVGRVIAEAMADRGADVAVHYRTSAREARTVQQVLRDRGVRSQIFRADLSRVGEARALVGKVVRALGRLDVLVNSASVYDSTAWAKVQERDWERHMRTNARGPFFLAQAAGRVMLRSGGGKIVNIVDADVARPYRRYLPYLVSKAALLGVTWCLAKELAPTVQVNAVAPGPVLLPEAWGRKVREAIVRETPLRRLGSPEDVARAVVFLVEGGDYITGAVLPVDGGRHIG
ncbi:MAG: SDR family oxidoreductase [Nitrospirae bacterium]|nr:SDR family oxidoreductase [Nitrospirota bacterium]